MAQYYGLFKLNFCIFLRNFQAGGGEGVQVDLQEVSGAGVDAGEELYHFGGLHGGDNSGEWSEHSSCRAWREAALARGVKITGATVHFVNDGMDTGPIIMQKAVKVRDGDTPETLQKRVMEEAEWVLLPWCINLIAAGQIRVENGRVTIAE